MTAAPRRQPDDQRGAPSELTRASVRAAAWAIGGQFVAEPIRVLGTAIMARLLSPQDFGLMGMATVFLGLTAISNELGLGAAVIRHRELGRAQLSSLFWASALAGAAITAACVIASPLVASVYRQPAVGPLFAALSFTVLLNAVTLVQNAALRRDMDFRSPAIANIFAVTVNGVAAVVAYLLGARTWALVIGTLAGSVAFAVVIQVASRFRPAARLRWSDVRPHLTFGAEVSAAETANYAATNVDNLLVGRLIGAGALGVYALAYNLVTYPVRMVSNLVAGVAMPAFSRVAEDRSRLRGGYLRAVTLSAYLTWPVLAVAIAAGPALVTGLYGPKWSGAVLPFQVLCAAGMARSVTAFGRSALKASGHSRAQLVGDTALLVAVSVGVALAAPLGVVAVAAVVAFATAAVSLAVQVVVGSAIGLSLAEAGRALVRPAVLALVTGLAGWGTALALGSLPPILTAAIAILAPLLAAWVVGRRSRALPEIAELERLVRQAIDRREDGANSNPQPLVEVGNAAGR